MSKIIIVLIVLLVIILICRSCVFPLSAGSIDSGLQASKSLRSQSRTAEYPLVAVIVEPREENLVKIVRHFMRVMPHYTHFQIYHGTKNKNLLINNFTDEIYIGKISLWDMGVDNLTIQGYSALLTSKEFWQTVQSERVLIFQTDAITCGQSKFKIEDFWDYDFVGAPVANYISALIVVLFMGKGYLTGHTNFYNGGLSYRTRSKMLAVIEEHPWDQLCTEDVWFCTFLPRVGGRLPDRETARKFSFEAEELVGTPWGVHKPRKERGALMDVCPEIKEIPFVPTHTDYRNLYLL